MKRIGVQVVLDQQGQLRMTRRMLINAGVIILILCVWMMVAGSIAPDLVILGQSLAAWSVLITVVGGVYLYRQLLTFLPRSPDFAHHDVTGVAFQFDT